MFFLEPHYIVEFLQAPKELLMESFLDWSLWGNQVLVGPVLVVLIHYMYTYPKPSMYGIIFSYIWLIFFGKCR